MPVRFFLLALFVAALACGCSAPESNAPVESDAFAQSNASAEDTAEAASFTTFECESGETVRASYPTDSTAVVKYAGRTLRMNIAVSASGARYVGEELEWWTKGSGPGSSGTLFRHESDGTSRASVTQCEWSDGDSA